jgi:hypothetical protein
MERNMALELLSRHGDFEDARPLVHVEGLSSPRVCNFLNELVRHMDPGECYLEIGTFRGLTLLSAAFGNRDRCCIGCDRFRLWGEFTGLGRFAKRALQRNIDRYRDDTGAVTVHACNSRRLFGRVNFPGPIGVYFYDGDHSYEGTRHGIVAAGPYLAERAIVLVDDWNDPVIVRATADAWEPAGMRVLWSRALAGDHSNKGWWNGLGVFWVERAL